jgi:hypothetical protein
MENLSYISENINDLEISDRKTVLRMIYESESKEHLEEKGGGTQIHVNLLSDKLITDIYEFVKLKIGEQKQTLKSYKL